LQAGRWQPWELHLSDRLPRAESRAARALAERLGIAVSVAPPEELTRLCRSAEHQGYLAKMPPFPYADAEEVLSALPPQPFCAILDSIQDPYNFGAILRSADALGVDAVFVGKERQSPVNSLVARSSAGAVNHVPLAQVDDLAELAAQLKARGHALVGATEQARLAIGDCNLRAATTIVIGNEGSGIREQLLAACDRQVAIPQAGHVGSLNAAVAAGILFYEARRQRTPQ
jgi:23S rRNA (guanosine2251-2'-O)-methyltransferase